MVRLILNHDHLLGALVEAMECCRHRLFISTADVKDLYFPPEGMTRVAGKLRTGMNNCCGMSVHECD